MRLVSRWSAPLIDEDAELELVTVADDGVDSIGERLAIRRDDAVQNS